MYLFILFYFILFYKIACEFCASMVLKMIICLKMLLLTCRNLNGAEMGFNSSEMNSKSTKKALLNQKYR